MLQIDDRLLAYEQVRAVAAEYAEVVAAMDRCSARLAAMAETNWSDAMARDARHMCRRARLHVRQVAARELAEGVRAAPSSRPPASLTAPAIDIGTGLHRKASNDG